MTGPLHVIVHEATRSGSTIVALELIRDLRRRTEVPVAVRLLTGGPLAGELRAAANASETSAPGAMLVNSSVALTDLGPVDASVPVAVYLHEDEEALRRMPPSALGFLVDRAAMVICVSAGVGDQLTMLGVDPRRTRVLPPVVRRLSVPTPAELAAARYRCCADAPPGPGTRLVVACGEPAWHKGADIFVELALLVSRRATEDVRFAWIGRRSRSLARVLDHDVSAAGLGGRVIWIGDVDDPAPYLAAADVVVMPSRRDAQPLVPFEAASLGTPTVAFAVGGLASLGERRAIHTAPYPDTSALADSIVSLLGDPAACRALVAEADAIAESESSIDAIGPKFADAIQELMTYRAVASHEPAGPR